MTFIWLAVKDRCWTTKGVGCLIQLGALFVTRMKNQFSTYWSLACLPAKFGQKSYRGWGWLQQHHSLQLLNFQAGCVWLSKTLLRKCARDSIHWLSWLLGRSGNTGMSVSSMVLILVLLWFCNQQQMRASFAAQLELVHLQKFLLSLLNLDFQSKIGALAVFTSSEW